MKELKFKNRQHELNYRVQMNSIPAELRSLPEIQAAIYFIALLECASPDAAEYIWRFVRRSLLPGFFDNPDTKVIVEFLARRLWEATYIAFREDFLYYFCEAFLLGLGAILHCDMLDSYVKLLEYFKDIDGEERWFGK